LDISGSTYTTIVADDNHPTSSLSRRIELIWTSVQESISTVDDNSEVAFRNRDAVCYCNQVLFSDSCVEVMNAWSVQTAENNLVKRSIKKFSTGEELTRFKNVLWLVLLKEEPGNAGLAVTLAHTGADTNVI